jgi:hypothetical protein
MKFFIPFIAAFLMIFILSAQERQVLNFSKNKVLTDSTKGYSLPAFDTIKALVVLVKFREDNLPGEFWPPDATVPPDVFKDIFATSPHRIPKGSITHYLQEASFSKLFYYADLYPEIVDLDSPITYYHKNGGYSATNAAAVKKVIASGKVNWNDYDNWSKSGNIHRKAPDGVVDNIVLIYRHSSFQVDPESHWFGSGGGVAALMTGVIPVNDSMIIRGGSLQSGLFINRGNTDIPTIFHILKHELAHFYTIHHYSSGEDFDGVDFTTHGSWAFAAASGSSA